MWYGALSILIFDDVQFCLNSIDVYDCSLPTTNLMKAGAKCFFGGMSIPAHSNQ